MRIDLEGRKRSWWTRLLLRLVKRITGIVPGPMWVMTRKPDLLGPDLRRYLLQGMRGSVRWSKGETELMAAFVADLNRCRF